MNDFILNTDLNLDEEEVKNAKKIAEQDIKEDEDIIKVRERHILQPPYNY